MSRNGSGTYTLPAGNPVVTGTTITTTWANTTLNDVASSLTGSVAADGQTPMSGSLNMANNKIIAVLDPTLAQDAATKLYVDTADALALLKANNLSDVASATTSRTNLVAAKSGANSDITSLTGLTTPLTVGQGGTGSASTTYCNLTTNVTGTLPVTNGGTGVTTSTGSGANVLGTSPTIATPTITGNITDGTYTTSVASTAQGTAKAWVNFNGTTASPSTIRASYNVTSVTKNGTGDYTINLTTALADANGAVVVGESYLNTRGDAWSNHNTIPSAYMASSSTVNVQTGIASANAYYDVTTFSVAVFR